MGFDVTNFKDRHYCISTSFLFVGSIESVRSVIQGFQIKYIWASQVIALLTVLLQCKYGVKSTFDFGKRWKIGFFSQSELAT